MHPSLGIAICLPLLLAAVAPARADEDPEALLAAAERHEAVLAATPDDFEARLGAATALNRAMAIRTNANLPRIDGLQDTAENRALWGELGPRALEHARQAARLRPDSVEAAAQLATAYMFYASSLGILRAILEGSGGEYRQHARRVIELDPRHDDAIGHTLLAGFYLVAPWPIRDLDAARDAYRKAARLAPDSVRNQYGLGVYFVRAGEPARARPHFERALAMPCTGGSERLVCDWLKRESRRALSALAD